MKVFSDSHLLQTPAMDSTEKVASCCFLASPFRFFTTMANHDRKTASNKVITTTPDAAPDESRASESLTVLWAVTVLMVLVANLLTVAAHFYLSVNPAAEKMALLKGLLLFTSSLVGGVSLVLLPILYYIRQVPPPPGLAAFGACVAAAPLLTVLVQSVQ